MILVKYLQLAEVRTCSAEFRKIHRKLVLKSLLNTVAGFRVGILSKRLLPRRFPVNFAKS